MRAPAQSPGRDGRYRPAVRRPGEGSPTGAKHGGQQLDSLGQAELEALIASKTRQAAIACAKICKQKIERARAEERVLLSRSDGIATWSAGRQWSPPPPAATAATAWSRGFFDEERMLLGNPDAASASKRRSTFGACRIASGRLNGEEFVVDCRRILRKFVLGRSRYESAWKMPGEAPTPPDSRRGSKESAEGADRVSDKEPQPLQPATVAKIVKLTFKLFGDKILGDDDPARCAERSHTIGDLSPASSAMRKASLSEDGLDGRGGTRRQSRNRRQVRVETTFD